MLERGAHPPCSTLGATVITDPPPTTPLAITLAGLPLRNPVILAAGTCGYVDEMKDALDFRHIGAVTTKSITRRPREGNRPTRIIGGKAGMFNAIGLANIGLQRFISEKASLIKTCGARVIGSIAGDSIDDYVEVATTFDAISDLPAVELNVSCPNTTDGLVFGEHPGELRSLLRAVRPVLVNTKMFVKLSPDATSIVRMAEEAIESGADALTISNTFTALSIDVAARRPRISNGKAGYSGPGIHPLVTRMIHDVYRDVARDAGVPIIGLGGVLDWEDAAEFILAGASAVGVGTALFVDPKAPQRIVRGLERWLDREGVSSLGHLVGELRSPTD